MPWRVEGTAEAAANGCDSDINVLPAYGESYKGLALPRKAKGHQNQQ